jgi:tetratricopeptide (TPR) repeat protein
MAAGRYESALSTFQTILSLFPADLSRVLDAAEGTLPFSDIVARLLPSDPQEIIRVARTRYRGTADEHRQMLLEKALTLLDNQQGDEAEKFYLKGVAHQLQGKLAEAARELTEAVRLAPTEHIWRYELALTFRSLGDWNAAEEQANWCVLLSPANARYKDLLKSIMGRNIGG